MSESLLRNLIRDRKAPDILTCIANLSSDEVFTPPELVDKVLDLLPEEVWHDKNLRWLDPACKTGIFLRQIARRLMDSLREEFPDEAERRRHIFQNMLFGIAITDLTALMSRRSLYTSKNANGEKSIAGFENENGNIDYENRKHSYKNGNCIYCGNREGGELDRDDSKERHAYKFIHLTEEEARKMKFDVIVGNPPYQLSDGGFGASATPIYQLFVEQAIKLKPRYLAFIIPSRWFVGGKGLDKFRDDMLKDHHIQKLVDFPDSSDCFPGVDIKGGVCYFVRDDQYGGPCECEIYNNNEIASKSTRYLSDGDAGIFIRYPEMLDILKKVRARHEETFDSLVSSMKPYGLRTDAFKDPEKYNLGKLYTNKDNVGGLAVEIYGQIGGKRISRFVSAKYSFPKGQDMLSAWKIFIPRAFGSGAIGERVPSPIIAGSLSACTETFVQVGPLPDEQHAKNIITYMNTKLFRLLVSIKKTTQDAPKDKYSFVPLLPMNQEWTDKKLYERYELTDEEIKFIESMIKEMK